MKRSYLRSVATCWMSIWKVKRSKLRSVLLPFLWTLQALLPISSPLRAPVMSKLWTVYWSSEISQQTSQINHARFPANPSKNLPRHHQRVLRHLVLMKSSPYSSLQLCTYSQVLPLDSIRTVLLYTGNTLVLLHCTLHHLNKAIIWIFYNNMNPIHSNPTGYLSTYRK